MAKNENVTNKTTKNSNVSNRIFFIGSIVFGIVLLFELILIINLGSKLNDESDTDILTTLEVSGNVILDDTTDMMKKIENCEVQTDRVLGLMNNATALNERIIKQASDNTAAVNKVAENVSEVNIELELLKKQVEEFKRFEQDVNIILANQTTVSLTEDGAIVIYDPEVGKRQFVSEFFAVENLADIQKTIDEKVEEVGEAYVEEEKKKRNVFSRLKFWGKKKDSKDDNDRDEE